MPHVRFTRDKRGYEHTFLVRRGPKGRGDATVLYWFRTPPDVRVGRRPLDADATDAIEHAFPDIRFDWPRLREAHAARAAGEERTSDTRPERRGAERRMPRRRPGPPAAQEQASAHPDPAAHPDQRHTGPANASHTDPSPGETSGLSQTAGRPSSS